MRAEGLAIAAAIAWSCSACEDVPELRPPTPRSDTAAPSFSNVKRPSKVYFLTNDNQECFVQWHEGEERSTKTEAMCPREVAPGERIRLTGKTCVRVSSTQSRNVPVRCPYALVSTEAEDRAKDAKDE